MGHGPRGDAGYRQGEAKFGEAVAAFVADDVDLDKTWSDLVSFRPDIFSRKTAVSRSHVPVLQAEGRSLCGVARSCAERDGVSGAR
jgi:hypothetical protein